VHRDKTKIIAMFRF